MPLALENELKRSYEKKHPAGVSEDQYVYGAMNNMGAMHGNKETAKGKAMEAKHKQDALDMAHALGKAKRKKKK